MIVTSWNQTDRKNKCCLVTFAEVTCHSVLRAGHGIGQSSDGKESTHTWCLHATPAGGYIFWDFGTSLVFGMLLGNLEVP